MTILLLYIAGCLLALSVIALAMMLLARPFLKSAPEFGIPMLLFWTLILTVLWRSLLSVALIALPISLIPIVGPILSAIITGIVLIKYIWRLTAGVIEGFCTETGRELTAKAVAWQKANPAR